MGQHKTNPTAIAAKNGELPPKQRPLSKRERERLLYEEIDYFLFERFRKAYFKMMTEGEVNKK